MIIVGLGNIGKSYENTYHNMGFMFLDYYAKLKGLKFTKNKYNSMVCETKMADNKVIFLKPTTLMNNSGIAVGEAVKMNKTLLQEVLVVYDDIDLPLGSFRLRKSGSAGTHNGMRNIVELLHSDEFPRLRIGIGKPEYGSLADYVLSNVKEDNKKIVEANYDKFVKIVDMFIQNKTVENIDISKL